jgi:LacI family transcriptional regulator
VADVTLRDVADMARVHSSTASRALNERTRGLVNEATVRRVLAAAERLGYQPNVLARGLRSNRTGSVGMLIPDLTNPLFPPIIRAIEDRLRVADVTLLIASTSNDPDRERDLLDLMASRRVDGLIVATARRSDPALEQYVRSGNPVVLLNRTIDEPVLPSVAADDHIGVGLILRHLRDLGHRRIAHVAGNPVASTGLERYQNFLSWARVLDLDTDDALVVQARWFNQPDGAAAFRVLLDRGVDFTAVFAANDLVALGVYDVCAERGIRIPEDLSVVGFNDIPFTDRFAPPLTSVRLPHAEIGRRAAELLLSAIDDPSSATMSIRLAPELIVRGSTAAPRTGPLPTATRAS